MNKKKAIAISLMILVVAIVIGLFVFNKGEDKEPELIELEDTQQRIFQV